MLDNVSFITSNTVFPETARTVKFNQLLAQATRRQKQPTVTELHFHHVSITYLACDAQQMVLVHNGDTESSAGRHNNTTLQH